MSSGEWKSGTITTQQQIEYLELLDEHANYIEVLEDSLELSSGMKV